MSGYFDALLRSGGMAAAAPARPAAPEPGLEAIGEEPATPPPVEVQAAPVPAAASTEPAAMLAPTARPAPALATPLPDPSGLPPTPASTAADKEPPPAASQQHRTPEQTAEPPAIQPTRAADPGRALIQAALDWVAAGPQAEPGQVSSESATAPPRDAQPATAPVPAEPRRSEAIALPPAATSTVLRDALHDETVEISIGTILVRVDAPAVPAAAAPPVPAPPPSVSRPTRGALARRSLRRF